MRIYKTTMKTMDEERIKLSKEQVILLTNGDDSIFTEDAEDYFEANGVTVEIVERSEIPRDYENVYSNIIYRKKRLIPKLEPLTYYEGHKLKEGIYFKDDEGEVYRIEKFTSDRIVFELEDGTKKKVTFRRKKN